MKLFCYIYQRYFNEYNNKIYNFNKKNINCFWYEYYNFNTKNILKTPKNKNIPFNLKEYNFYNLFLSFYVKKKSKIEYFIKINDNIFLSDEDKNKFTNIFSKIQKTIFYLNCFVRKYKYKKSEIKIDTDLFLNKINETQYNVITIFQNNCKYLFTVSDLLHIIKNSICNTDEFYPEPIACKNPYNNVPFNRSSLLNIYFFIKNRNYVMPDFLHNYFLVYFNLYEFKVNNESIIANHSICLYINNTSVISLYKKILDMIVYYNNNRYYSRINKKIIIDDDFPKEILIKAFKKYLHIYLKIKYYPNNNFKKHKNELLNKLGLFSSTNPTFGRKILIFNKKNKINSFYFNNTYIYPILYNEDSTHKFEINPYRRNYDNINYVNYNNINHTIEEQNEGFLDVLNNFRGYSSDPEYYNNNISDDSSDDSSDNSSDDSSDELIINNITNNSQDPRTNNLMNRLDNLERQVDLLRNNDLLDNEDLNTNIFTGTHLRFEE